jgi:hypothetical protein
MLFPGIYTRRDSLARAAVEAIRLVAGTVPLLVIAGTLEAFLSPSGAPMAVKFLTGAVLLLGLGLWLTSQSSVGARTEDTHPMPASSQKKSTAGRALSLPDTH